MITACSHCGAKYQLPDKMLGRSARCKTCDKHFLIEHAQDSPEAKAASKPVAAPSNEPLDPLEALAHAAADESPAPRVRSHSIARETEEEDHRPSRVRKARGATLALVMGIAALLLTLAAVVCGIVVMSFGDSQELVKVLGVVTILLVLIATAFGMIAAVNGNSASRSIRRARHPLAGRGHASAGTLTGGIALLLVTGLIIAGVIWLANRGGLNFEQQLDAQGNPVVQTERVDPPGEASDSPALDSGASTTADETSTPAASATTTEVEIDDATAATIGIAFLLIVIVVGLLSVVVFAFWLWMLIDCCNKTFKGNEKTMWLLLIIFLGGLGALIYFFAGRPNAVKPDRQQR